MEIGSTIGLVRLYQARADPALEPAGLALMQGRETKVRKA